jgi:hypothetical protein
MSTQTEAFMRIKGAVYAKIRHYCGDVAHSEAEIKKDKSEAFTLYASCIDHIHRKDGLHISIIGYEDDRFFANIIYSLDLQLATLIKPKPQKSKLIPAAALKIMTGQNGKEKLFCGHSRPWREVASYEDEAKKTGWLYPPCEKCSMTMAKQGESWQPLFVK